MQSFSDTWPGLPVGAACSLIADVPDGAADPGLGRGGIQGGPPYLGHLGRHIHGRLILDADAKLLVLQIQGLAEHIYVGLHMVGR